MNSSKTDVVLLFATRLIRLFAYGFLSVILTLYLVEVGLSVPEIGLLLTLTLFGDALISLVLTTSADRFGRRKTLLIGAMLMAIAGAVFVFTNNFVVLLIAAIIGVISPSGNEIGPFLAVEQASLTALLPDQKRTQVFAWYNLVGSFATATGSLLGGIVPQQLQQMNFTALEAYRIVLLGYVLMGLLLTVLFACLSSRIEIHSTLTSFSHKFGLHRSRATVFKLSMLFALDAFAGGFIVQSIVAYWFHLKFGVNEGGLGLIFFGANILAGISALLAGAIAARIGLINTMVFTHIPSNILLCMVPFMPSLGWAVAILMIRFSISQMDVPTRQSYTMAIVAPDERSAAAGITTIARSIGAAASPALSGLLLVAPGLLALPFLISGGIKIVYDVLLYRAFKTLRPPEEL